MFEGELIGTIPPGTAPAYYRTERHVFECGEARVRFLHAGKDIKAAHYYTWVDCDSPGSGIDPAITEARERAAHYLVTPESSLEIIVEHRRFRVVKYRNGVPDDHKRQRHYEIERDQSPVRGQEFTTTIWSSKTPDVRQPITDRPADWPMQFPPLSGVPATGDQATPQANPNQTQNTK